MGGDDWKRAKQALLEALSLDPRERAAYLERADLTADARAEVESLLALEGEARDFMSLPAREFSRDILVGRGPEAGELAGQLIGAYEIVSDLGAGGMGTVYLARRADGKFEQQVAVKMLRREFNTARLRRTFDREKEILAALSHPYIARLLDAGTAPDGVPFLVMEYVRGEPIDRYCRGRGLSLNDRLKLFNKVCEAVSYAHRSLVVHRDLKPSNILVGEGGEPKLLDFGISKLLGADAGVAGHATHMVALTPQYASPEQLRGEAVTTAADVYSLGVVLYNLLTESLPYSAAGRTTDEVLRQITEASPRPPSEAALTPHTMSRLKGDLDNIVLKALSREPERRYQTVEQFSADVWRFVDGLPVLARPATLSYRASKFYGRKKGSVWAVALIFLSLCAGLTAALWQAGAARVQARLASEARHRAEQEAERARGEKERAEKTSRFMQSFLNYANPHWSGLGNRDEGRTDFTVREALHDVVARMDTELADAPEVRADLHYTIGEVYIGSGERERARRHFSRSLDLYRQVHGDEHPKVARGMYYVSLFETDIEKKEPLLRQAIGIMRRTDPENVNLPHMLQDLAGRVVRAERESRDAARLAEAEGLIGEAKALFIRHHGEDHDFTISTDDVFSQLALVRGDLAWAESKREELLRRYRQTHEGLSEHIWALLYLGEVKLRRGKETEAETCFRQALELARRRWDANDPRFMQLSTAIHEVRTAANN